MTSPLQEDGEARAELIAMARHLEDVRRGLGAELLDAAARALSDIARDPDSRSPYLEAPGLLLRSRRIGRFRVRIVYAISAGAVHILAYAHDSREPGHWRARRR
ncbi:hypothetical protein ACXET9_08695 [Brachybacterium sp. DNPG3]